MFNPALFEEKIYAFVTQEVNNVFSELLTKGMAGQDGVRVQKQMMEALHSVTEETVMQISYGLLIRKSSA